jgi:hypothetical protein
MSFYHVSFIASITFDWLMVQILNVKQTCFRPVIVSKHTFNWHSMQMIRQHDKYGHSLSKTFIFSHDDKIYHLARPLWHSCKHCLRLADICIPLIILKHDEITLHQHIISLFERHEPLSPQIQTLVDNLH